MIRRILRKGKGIGHAWPADGPLQGHWYYLRGMATHLDQPEIALRRLMTADNHFRLQGDCAAMAIKGHTFTSNGSVILNPTRSTTPLKGKDKGKGKDSPGGPEKGKDSKGKKGAGSNKGKGKNSKGKDAKGKDARGKDAKGKDAKGQHGKGKDSKGNANNNKGKGPY